MSAAPAPAPDPDVLVTSRPLDEYCALFDLTRAGLAALPGPLLDCPGGAAGLAAEARELGCRVIAADPAYALPLPAVEAQALAARKSMAVAMAARPHLYPEAGRHRPERYLRSWDRARRLFTADSAAHPQRYVAAALPRLPFADGTFALTLSGYLLFAYPELFCPERQLAALIELVRVTPGRRGPRPASARRVRAPLRTPRPAAVRARRAPDLQRGPQRPPGGRPHPPGAGAADRRPAPPGVAASPESVMVTGAVCSYTRGS
ncbi:hypothetical protein ABT247_31675 [Kitasatospora sp. NPDC001539]|uniref:hypothetical protein n=1 Tax=Kitasatospora sp. NPDC001539 TaxID=3154384 RepID=UPI003328FBAA